METSRRDFLGRVAATTAMLGALPLPAGATSLAVERLTADEGGAPADWDLSWVNRITTKHRALFDVPEIENGYGVWRASIWVNQYADTLKVPVKDMTPVLVLRHTAIWLAMQQPMWDAHGVGKMKTVMHPVTLQPTDRNPALLTAADGAPAPFDSFALPKFLARGGIALACDLALQFEVVRAIQGKDNVSPEEAHKRAVAGLVPGVILQPSGVFAAIRAQDAGCRYLRAS
jgi:hypothetical protein